MVLGGVENGKDGGTKESICGRVRSCIAVILVASEGTIPGQRSGWIGLTAPSLCRMPLVHGELVRGARGLCGSSSAVDDEREPMAHWTT